VKAFIHCSLDYCNALLAGTADIEIKWRQSLQLPADRLAPGPFTLILHRLAFSGVSGAVHDRIQVLFVWKCIYGVAPACLLALCPASGKCLMSSSVTIGFNWVYPTARNTDINWSAKLRILEAHCVKQSAVCSTRQVLPPAMNSIRHRCDVSTTQATPQMSWFYSLNCLHFEKDGGKATGNAALASCQTSSVTLKGR